MRFRATVQLDGKTATGINVPDEVVEGLGSGKRARVKVTINGHEYSTTFGSMRGVTKIPVSAEHRKAAGLAAGDEVDVEVELDDSPQELAVPADLADALKTEAEAQRCFDGLSPSRRKAYVTWIEQAKKAETRERRVAQAVEELREGRPRR
ncbi:YdeI/OmpD-associated family protein [Actinoallomurus sp. NPDC050550]|uniref:YdeI/OmpD-associated family protein n=1 Tax=Actinoallomurus sp. NPDC050550 TaxID=3154937 RepID=UPI0033D8AC1E